MSRRTSFLTAVTAGLAFNFGAPRADAQVVIAPLATWGDTVNSPGWLPPGFNGDAYLGTGNNERGLAFGNGHVYLVSHATVGGTTANVRILNAATGADLGGLNNTGIAGGTFTVNAAGVGTDGSIYVANLTTQSTTTAFKVYKWLSEAAAPTVAYSGDSGLPGSRVGDSLAAIGSGSSTRVAAGYNSSPAVAGNNGYAVVDPTAGTSAAIGFTGTPPNAGDFRLGLTFADASHVIGTAGSSLYRYSSYSGTAGTLVASPAIPDPAGATADRLLGIAPALIGGLQLLAVQSIGDSHVSIYDVTNPSAPAYLASGNTTVGTLTANANGTGQLAWDIIDANDAVLYAMSTNQGIQAFTITAAPVPEPTSLALLGLAGAGLVIRRFRRRNW